MQRRDGGRDGNAGRDLRVGIRLHSNFRPNTRQKGRGGEIIMFVQVRGELERERIQRKRNTFPDRDEIHNRTKLGRSYGGKTNSEEGGRRR